MRRALSFLGARGVITLGIVVVVLAIVGAAKLVSGSGTATGPRPGGVETETYVNPTAGDDGLVSTPPAATDDPAARSVATDFATAWLRSDVTPQAWHAGVSQYATTELAQNLNGVDPKGVPATRMTGPAKVTLHADEYAEVVVPVDTGTLRLSLVRDEDGWSVDGVDWERA